jgi:NADP-dependent 3-hydroxy acid dehydrogenase YdfG
MHAMKVDVTIKSDWEAALKEATSRWGRIDIVINNAGTTYKNKVTRIPEISSMSCSSGTGLMLI